MRHLDVGVIGCGTAGAATAVFLARAGHRVTVYERVPDPGPVGAGITLQPTGLHVLARLGLDAHVLARGARIGRLLCETPSRRRIVALDYADAGPEMFGLGLHRGVLFEALHGALVESGVLLRTGVDVDDVIARGKHAWITTREGTREGPHDLVVVGSGARSRFHAGRALRSSEAPYPWGALWFVGEERRSPDDARTSMLHQVCDGTRRFLGMLPTGRGPKDGSSPLVSLFWSVRASSVPAWRARGLGPWKDELLALAPECAPILDQIHDVDQVLFAAYHDVVMRRFSTRNVVFLGDAAHATSPQLGQGCNLALWDAMTLADALAQEPQDLARALDRYGRSRSDHLAFYQLATRWLTPFFQSDLAWLGPLRDVFMPALCAVPATRKLMTLSMLGVVDGFEGRTLSVGLPPAGEP